MLYSLRYVFPWQISPDLEQPIPDNVSCRKVGSIFVVIGVEWVTLNRDTGGREFSMWIKFNDIITTNNSEIQVQKFMVYWGPLSSIKLMLFL